MKRQLYNKHLTIGYTPVGGGGNARRTRLEKGFYASKMAIQDHERAATKARHDLDEQEMRKSQIKYMRITEEAAAARKRATEAEERLLAKERRQAQVHCDTAGVRKRMEELLNFQKQQAKRRKERAEEEALLKARELEDERRKVEQRRKLKEAKEKREEEA